MMKPYLKLTRKEKLALKKKFWKLLASKQGDWLKIYPTLFGSDSSVTNIMQYPNILLYNGTTSISNAGPAGPGVTAYSSTTHPITVPYVVTFQNMQTGGLNRSGDIGLGIANTTYAGVTVNISLYNGSGWNDSALLSSNFGLTTINSNSTQSNVGSTVLLSNTATFSQTANTLVTIQEYTAGNIWTCVTDLTGTVFILPWTQIGNPWQTANETRCVVTAFFYSTGSENFSVDLVATPSVLLNFNN